MKLFGTSILCPKSARSSRALALTALVFFAGTAMAGTITPFTGQDDGSAIGGSNANSSAAQTSFQTAAGTFGATNTITFENVPLTTGASMNSAPFTAGPGVKAYTPGLNYNFFGLPGYTGVSNTSAGNGSNNNLYGFNTTPGGSVYLAVSATSSGNSTATFTFTTPTNSFGAFITGLQTKFTDAFTLTFNDGTAESLSYPVDVSGGAEYFGFTDTSTFTSVTLTSVSDLTNGGDAWGIDDVTYNGPSVEPVPEPSSLILLGTGVMGLAGAARRRLKRA